MLTILVFSGIILAIVLSGFFSGIETAAYSVNTIHLHASSNNGDKNATLVLLMLQNMPRLITTMLIGTNFSIFIATNLLTNYMSGQNYPNAELLTTLFLTPFCLIFAESLPKRIAFARPNTALIIFAKILFICEYIFYPFTLVLSGLGNTLQYILDKKGSTNTELIGKIRLYENFEAKTAEGKISLEQYQMASRIMEHESTIIAELMLSPLETFTVEESISAREAGLQIRASGYARALLRNKFMRFTGKIVTVNTIMNNEEKLDRPVMEIAEKALILERKTSILHAISQMRDAGARIAIVTNRNGLFIGSVHFNSLINSIVRGLQERED